MNFKDLIEHSERKEPNNSMVLIENALKLGDQLSLKRLESLMNTKNNSLIQRCLIDYQNQSYDQYSEIEDSTFMHSKDYVPMKCWFLCG